MGTSSLIGTVLLVFTGLVTYKGLADHAYQQRHLFHVDSILVHGQYGRLFSAGFLHANWLHFGFNMIALLAFSFSLEFRFGIPRFLLLYLGSLLGGNLLALYLHRQHGSYRAVGASGAISGVVASSIILFPTSSISFILLPIEIKSWIFGLAFILISIFGIKSQRDNIGHEAHLGGALIGILLTLALQPAIIRPHWWIILLTLVPILLFLLLIIRNPAVLMIDNYWGENIRALRQPPPRQPPTLTPEQRLNQLLEKIRQKGITSLTPQEKQELEKLKDLL